MCIRDRGRRAGGRGRRERDAPKRCFPLAFFPILCHPPAPCEGAVLARERVPPLIGRGFRESPASVVLGFIFPNWSLVCALTVNFDFAQHADILTGEFNSRRGVKLRQSGLLITDLRFSRERNFQSGDAPGEGRRRRSVETRNPPRAPRGLDDLGDMSSARGRCACPNCQVTTAPSNGHVRG